MFGKKVDKLDRYEDPTGEFTNSELKMADWYIHHKARIRKIWIFILMTWSTITIVGGIVYWGYYLTIGYYNDQRMLNQQALELQNYSKMHSIYEATPIQVKNIQIYQSSSNKYDFVAEILNPNERWVAVLTYNFLYNGQETENQTTVILPKTERPLIIFGQNSESYPGGAQLNILETKWRKINPHVLEDVEQFVKERINFSYENFKFTPASRLFGAPANTIAIDVVNNSPYNYQHIDFYIQLSQNGEIVGYSYASVDGLMSKESRHVEKRILGENYAVTDIQVFPVVNVFDGESYILPT